MKIRNFINLAKVSMLSLGLFVASCTTETFEEIPQENGTELVKKFFGKDPILVQPLPDGTFQSGDINFFKEQLTDQAIGDLPPGEVEKLGQAPRIRKWENNTVVYVIDGSISQSVRNEIFEAMDEWTSKTNIRFKERTNESTYVTFRTNDGDCNCGDSTLGSAAGPNNRIRLGSRSSAGLIVHEIGHTLGFIHEQNRSDRDDFVDIFPQNIQNGAISQFRITQNSVNPGAFDVFSTMIYSSFTFSKNGQPVMLRKDGTRIPFRNGLSAGDIAGTNIIYPGGSTDPDPNPDPNPNPDDICEDVDEWVRGQRYRVGDRVTFRNFLFERDFSRWNRLGRCGTAPEADICEGIDPFNGNNGSYTAGDQVTYEGSLYERLSNGRWRNLGRCAN